MRLQKFTNLTALNEFLQGKTDCKTRVFKLSDDSFVYFVETEYSEEQEISPNTFS